jgi:hypothetical protein
LPVLRSFAICVTNRPTILDLAEFYSKCPALTELAICAPRWTFAERVRRKRTLEEKQLVTQWWGNRCRVIRTLGAFPIHLEDSPRFRVLSRWATPKHLDISRYFSERPPPWKTLQMVEKILDKPSSAATNWQAFREITNAL